MIAARWGMLLVAALPILAAFGATGRDMQPSALRLLVTAVIALLAPILWPGNAATPARTALRIAAWSASATCLAAIALRVLGDPPQPWPRILEGCTMLMVILLLTHAMVAGLEARLRVRSGDAQGAREMAGRTVAISLALLGSLPLWFGPLGELLSARHGWIIDAVVGVSPLTHLAVASENDLLRNQWLYQHSNLAALQVTYPGRAGIALSYASAVLVLALVALALRRFPAHRPSADADLTDPTTEKKP